MGDTTKQNIILIFRIIAAVGALVYLIPSRATALLVIAMDTNRNGIFENAEYITAFSLYDPTIILPSFAQGSNPVIDQLLISSYILPLFLIVSLPLICLIIFSSILVILGAMRYKFGILHQMLQWLTLALCAWLIIIIFLIFNSLRNINQILTNSVGEAPPYDVVTDSLSIPLFNHQFIVGLSGQNQYSLTITLGTGFYLLLLFALLNIVNLIIGYTFTSGKVIKLKETGSSRRNEQQYEGFEDFEDDIFLEDKGSDVGGKEDYQDIPQDDGELDYEEDYTQF